LTEAVRGRARIPIAVTVLGDAEMPPAVKVACYYVAQEALNNVPDMRGPARCSCCSTVHPAGFG
ncbi:MAG: hypothetical protein ACKO9F_17945, partial [Caldilinea sp.]